MATCTDEEVSKTNAYVSCVSSEAECSSDEPLPPYKLPELPTSRRSCSFRIANPHTGVASALIVACLC